MGNDEEDEDGPVFLAITTLSLPDGAVGVAYSETLEAAGEFTPYTWSHESGDLPSGLSLDTATGEISGTPDTEDTYTFTIGVTDAVGYCDIRGFSITVNMLTIVTESPLPDGTVGGAYSTTLTATGGVAPYTWFVQTGDLPGGLFLDFSTGEISGTPDATGVSYFTIGLTDAVGNYQSKNFSITINVITITTQSPLPDGTLGVPYSTTLDADGGVPPYTWSVALGALPAGLSLDELTGEISGTPETKGAYAFIIRALDADGGYGTKSFSLTVNTVTITSEYLLPGGTVGKLYSTTLAAAGGVPLYAWSIEAGELPPGLSLNESTGEISGTLDTEGTYTFTIRVTDAVDGFDTKMFSIQVEVSTEHEVECYPQSSQYWTGYATSTQKYSGDIIVNYGSGTATRGYAKFDISSIPAGAEILSVTLHIYLSDVRDSFSGCRMRRLSVDPVTADGSAIYNDYGGAYVANSQSISSVGWKAVSFSATGILEFGSALTDGYIALKFYGC
jgi:hypothetical protein